MSQEFPVMLRWGRELIAANLIFEDYQTYDLDATKDELLFCSDMFLDRFSSNQESMTLRFAGRTRFFQSLDQMLFTLGESDIEVVSIAFDGVFYRELDNYLGWTLSRDRGYRPEDLRHKRETSNLIWEIV